MNALEPSEISNINGVMAYAFDAEAAGKLWALSEQLTDVKFGIHRPANH